MVNGARLGSAVLAAVVVVAAVGCNGGSSEAPEPEPAGDATPPVAEEAPAGGSAEIAVRVRATAESPVFIEGFVASTQLHGNGVDERWQTTVVKRRTGSRLGALELPRGSYRVHARALDPLASTRLMFGCERSVRVGSRRHSRTVVVALRRHSCEVRFMAHDSGPR